MVGDLKHGRTVHSLAKLLTIYNDSALNAATDSFVRLAAFVSSRIDHVALRFSTVARHASGSDELCGSGRHPPGTVQNRALSSVQRRGPFDSL